MKKLTILLSVSSLAIAVPAWAEDTAVASQGEGSEGSAVQSGPAKQRTFTTGVAKGRDMLDTAISASTFDQEDIQKISATSVVEIVGNLPGIRAESSGSDGFSAISIRGLPLAADGSKFLQIQEDGLPVLEFGDIHFASVDQFIRPDLSVAQIQSIRGGSASTFASNSPGGVVNFISRTGEQEGGIAELSVGLGYERYRLDFDYGGRLSDSMRFNVGGFYRQGEGPRDTGFDAFKGGQFKANVTKELPGGGYVRLYAKYLDDREPAYGLYPVGISGTNSSPRFENLPGLDIRSDALINKNTSATPGLDQNNQPVTQDLRNGLRAKIKSVGFETRFDVAKWTITDRFRFAGISGEYNELISFVTAPAGVVGLILGAPGGSFGYASGPNAGQMIADPSAINGNGLLSYGLHINAKLNSLDNLTNDLRASRVWNVGGGKFTTTAGLYFSQQKMNMYWDFLTYVQDLAGGGNSALVDVYTAGGAPVTQGGITSYALGAAPTYHRRYDTKHRILAPYGSVNFHIGKIALGASLRYDTGRVRGQLFSVDLGEGRVGSAAIDMNGDGVIVPIETDVTILPLGEPGPVHYNYHYLSYSVSANYRVADQFSVFGRYSRGARAGADRLLFPPSQDAATGRLTDPSTAFGYVKQAEVGAKYRTDHLSVFVTGFWASTSDKNYQIAADETGQTVVIPINRSYSAKGIELEAEARTGPFSLSLGATYTKAKIGRDEADPAIEGNRPRHQPDLFFYARPQFETERFTVGTSINGTTSSFAQDSNLLKQPGYVIFSPFVQIRPNGRMQIALNAFNVFDKMAFVQVGAPVVPASGIVNAQVLNGRTVTASVRVSF